MDLVDWLICRLVCWTVDHAPGPQLDFANSVIRVCQRCGKVFETRVPPGGLE